MIKLTQKINASASFTFSVASGGGHRETKLERLGLGQQSHTLPEDCMSPSLAPSLLVAASDVYREI